MNWITDQIAIGDYREAQDVGFMRSHGFRSVLGLISTLSNVDPETLGVDRIEVIELLDGPGNDPGRFVEVVDMLDRLLAEAAPVFVHCRAGWSRSPAVVAAYLKRAQGLTAMQALAAVASKRPTSVSSELRALVESA